MQNTEKVRIHAVDALRGFALAGIVIMHMVEQFIAAPRPTAAWDIEATLLDKVVNGLVFFLVGGKFFSMFALLFGISFAIMMRNAAQRGQSFSGRFLWRLSILLIFGMLHTLIYRGDILSLYATLGMILPLFFNIPNRWLWALTLALFLGLGRYIFFLITGKSTFLDYPLAPDSPAIIAYVNLLKTGTFTEVISENFTHGFTSKFDFLFGIFGRAYVTVGYFLVGIWIVRVGLADRIDQATPLLKRVLKWSIAALVLSYISMFGAFSLLPTPPDMATWGFAFAITFYDTANIATTAIWVCAFLLIFFKWRAGWNLALADYGRMALTNYLLQSVIGVLLLHGWALGLLGKLHDWQTLLMAFAVIYVQVKFSQWWLARYHYGPMEWLWRCATYFRRVPLRRTAPTSAELPVQTDN
jgi:uncharacterized protein